MRLTEEVRIELRRKKEKKKRKNKNKQKKWHATACCEKEVNNVCVIQG